MYVHSCSNRSPKDVQISTSTLSQAVFTSHNKKWSGANSRNAWPALALLADLTWPCLICPDLSLSGQRTWPDLAWSSDLPLPDLAWPTDVPSPYLTNWPVLFAIRCTDGHLIHPCTNLAPQYPRAGSMLQCLAIGAVIAPLSDGQWRATHRYVHLFATRDVMAG